MLRIAQIADLDTAKQVAQLLEKENARLHERLSAMAKEMAALQRKVFAALSLAVPWSKQRGPLHGAVQASIVAIHHMLPWSSRAAPCRAAKAVTRLFSS